MTEYKAFRVELADKIARVVINRPEKINAMDAAFWTEIIDIFNWVDATDDVRVVVLSGAGEHFSSGIDLQLLASVGSQLGMSGAMPSSCGARSCRCRLRSTRSTTAASLSSLRSRAMPGGAIDLISACDMRYSTVDAKFSIKEIDMGMAADVGTLQRLPRIIGDGMMRELAFTGRTIRGDEARSIGLVNRTYADQQALMEGVLELARDIASKSPIAIRGTRK